MRLRLRGNNKEVFSESTKTIIISFFFLLILFSFLKFKASSEAKEIEELFPDFNINEKIVLESSNHHKIDARVFFFNESSEPDKPTEAVVTLEKTPVHQSQG